MYFKNSNKKKFILLFLSFFGLLIASLYFDYYVNKDRILVYEPDDNFSYLIPATNHKYCKNNDCYEENFFKYPPSKNQEKSVIYRFERQIHRLVYDYTPLYTFLLDKISNKENIYKSQINYHLFLSLISTIAIFVYLRLSVDIKYIFLIVVILGTHYCVNNWGIKSSLAWTVSSFIGSLAVILQFTRRKLSLLLTLISVLFHQIGLTLLVMGYMVNLIYHFNLLFSVDNFKNFIKREIPFISIYLIIIILGLKFKYTPFDLSEVNVATVYTIDYFNLFNIFNSWKLNLIVFKDFFIKTIIFLNPLLLFFFLSSFFLKISDNFKIIKIYTVIFVLTIILFIHGVGEFAIGKRLWPIFVINYLILSISSIYFFSKKNIFFKYLKNIFLLSTPLFILINISLHIHPLSDIISRHNYHYDFENIKKFKKTIDKEEKTMIYFPDKETIFYYYVSAGLIQNNIFHKWQKLPENDLKKSNFIILDNPITIPRPSSDLLLKNDTRIIFDQNYGEYELIIYSKYKTRFSINKKEHSLNKGYNNIFLNKKNLDFNNIDTPLRIKGLKILKNQKLNWPWFEDIGFKIEYQSIRGHRYLFLKKYIYDLSYYYNFNELGKKINSNFVNCRKNIISDIDSSLIVSLDCKKSIL